ncbi:MAG: alginate export family protein [Candidatus Latescibacterota bacterium]|nr:alginate export family protein [Candidatus Latescibacterota bacterium]
MRRVTGWSRYVGWMLTLMLLMPAAPGVAQDSTVETLKELQELRKEVERRRNEMRRELMLLRQVLGEEVEPEFDGGFGSLGGMTPDELGAELRILREEIERLRDKITLEQLEARPERFDITGIVRSRLEWSDIDFVSGDADVRQLMRSRIKLTGRPRHDTRVIVEIQDGRAWGSESGLDPTFDADADHIDFHQAYIELQEIYGKQLTMRLGRQELAYGSGHLLGSAAWGNAGRSFDGLVFRYGEKSFVDLFVAKIAEQGVTDENLFGLYVDARLNDGHRAEPYVFLEQDKTLGVERLLRATGGLRIYGSATGETGHIFGYELEGIGQAGEVGNDDVLSYMGSATFRYRGPSWTQPEVRLGLDFLSGDDAPLDGDREAFDTMYPAWHTFFGLMDLFRDMPEDTGNGGLLDFRVQGEMSASESVRVGLHVHHFTLAKGVEKGLGQEADAIVTYRYNAATTLHWGGMIFVPSDAMKLSRGGEDPAFKTFMQLEVRF